MSRIYTLAEGCPQADSAATVQLKENQNVGGLVLLQSTQLIETLAHFSRERIPERLTIETPSAYGEFEVTHDVTDITSASFLNTIGKKTKCLLRISTVGPERGSADTVRDVHGWAMKLYTDEGNLDWVFNNTPIFFVRDPVNFHVGNPEGIHQLMHLFSDRGIPASLRQMDAFSGSTYKFTKEDGSFKYIKVHIKTQQGIRNYDRETAAKIAGENPDHHVQDLFEAIEKGDYPKWNVYVQVMDPKDAETYKWNIFDMTKVWPHEDYPLRQIGVLTLNENVGDAMKYGPDNLSAPN
ncbi:catalase A [Zalaria obscura]|uniref:Catalase A n=1 Tax=Zalaria obscura TaxID=2024903 RepID=A0ACC3S2C8_9PEZI